MLVLLFDPNIKHNQGENMKKAIIAVLSISIVLAVASNSFARNFQPYAGFGVGASYMDTGISNVTGSATLDEDDSYVKVLGGLKFNDFFSLEASYANLGEASLSGNSGDRFTDGDGDVWVFTANNVKVTTETTTFALGGVVYLPLGKITKNKALNFLSPFVKIGLHSWDMDVTASVGVSQATTTDDGTDLFFGTGVNFDLGEHFALRVDYEIFNIDDSNGLNDSISTFGLNGIVKF